MKGRAKQIQLSEEVLEHSDHNSDIVCFSDWVETIYRAFYIEDKLMSKKIVELNKMIVYLEERIAKAEQDRTEDKTHYTDTEIFFFTHEARKALSHMSRKKVRFEFMHRFNRPNMTSDEFDRLLTLYS